MSTAGVTVKDAKVGKAKMHFGPSALVQVKCKVGQGKQKNELKVKRLSTRLSPPDFPCTLLDTVPS
eukprot:COSAG02_NODE_5441_length_4327_cov_32.830889_1_plen_65_part_10